MADRRLQARTVDPLRAVWDGAPKARSRKPRVRRRRFSEMGAPPFARAWIDRRGSTLRFGILVRHPRARQRAQRAAHSGRAVNRPSLFASLQDGQTAEKTSA